VFCWLGEATVEICVMPTMICPHTWMDMGTRSEAARQYRSVAELADLDRKIERMPV
jgi:hypothetical protein